MKIRLYLSANQIQYLAHSLSISCEEMLVSIDVKPTAKNLYGLKLNPARTLALSYLMQLKGKKLETVLQEAGSWLTRKQILNYLTLIDIEHIESHHKDLILETDKQVRLYSHRCLTWAYTEADELRTHILANPLAEIVRAHGNEAAFTHWLRGIYSRKCKRKSFSRLESIKRTRDWMRGETLIPAEALALIESKHKGFTSRYAEWVGQLTAIYSRL